METVFVFHLTNGSSLNVASVESSSGAALTTLVGISAALAGNGSVIVTDTNNIQRVVVAYTILEVYLSAQVQPTYENATGPFVAL